MLERVLLAEYSELKREQVDRISRRDQLVYASLTAAAAVLAAVLANLGPAGLLLLPPVCLALGGTYVRNDRHVRHIKAYLRDDLGLRLGSLAGESVLNWEDGPQRRRLAQVVVELVVFVVPAVAAVCAYAVTAGAGFAAVPLDVIGGAEILAAVVFAVSLCRFSRGEVADHA